MSVKKALLKDMLIWYMIISPVWTFFQMIYYYNHPEFGFSGEGYGLGTVTTILFPIIWILVFVFCRHIEMKNKEIDRLKAKCSESESGERK